MFVLPVEAMPAGKSLKSRAQKEGLVRVIVREMVAEAEVIVTDPQKLRRGE
jgi:hypothetical protein